MIDVLLQSFERFQTAIVGILGFLGVMYTIKKNADLSRQQHQRELEGKRRAVRKAVYSELKEVKRIYQDRVKMLREDHRDYQSAYIPDLALNSIYLDVIAKIGLLSASEIEALITAYALIAELPSRLMLLPSDLAPNDRQRPGYIYVDSAQIQNAEKMHESFLIKIDHALETIESNLDQTDIRNE